MSNQALRKTLFELVQVYQGKSDKYSKGQDEFHFYEGIIEGLLIAVCEIDKLNAEDKG